MIFFPGGIERVQEQYPWDDPFKNTQKSSPPSKAERIMEEVSPILQNPQASDAIKADREWAELQAQKQMDFQERMSSTAYQRMMADLEKAGLNPMLVAQLGGASTPQGQQAYSDSSQQLADLAREKAMFGLINTLLDNFGRLASSALGSVIPKTSIIRKVK